MKFQKTYEQLGRGMLLAHFENALYTMADNFLEGYEGGLWQEVPTKNGFFWVLRDEGEEFNISTPGGSKKFGVSAEFAGLALTEMAFSYLLEMAHYGKIKLSNDEFDKIILLKRAIGDYVYDEKNDENFSSEYFSVKCSAKMRH